MVVDILVTEPAVTGVVVIEVEDAISVNALLVGVIVNKKRSTRKIAQLSY